MPSKSIASWSRSVNSWMLIWSGGMRSRPFACPCPLLALRGERWRDQRGGAADSGDGGSGGHPAQEVAAVDERDLVFRAEVVFLIGVHAR